MIRCLIFLAACLIASESFSQQRDTPSKNDLHFFEKHVRPVLVDRCLKCHSTGSEEIGGNLLLDSKAGWTKGGDLGPAIVPGDPKQSLLIQVITPGGNDIEMPPDGRLSPNERKILADWIQNGAADPRSGKAIAKKRIDIESGKSFWAFQSPHRKTTAVPDAVLEFDHHSNNELDRFIQVKLHENELSPSAPANRTDLIRRVTFGLTGLPPTPDAIADFLSNDSEDAFEKVVDRLLASPRYGEHWGRYWLDVARYADSNGLDENIAHGNAWRYRDYVVDAFNSDKPYNEFVREQIAGDLLTSADDQTRTSRLIATGFLSLGPKVLAEVDQTKMQMDIVDEQVDTVGRAFMGMTFGCARCHDHKFDPIQTEDYYALAGIFKSTKTMEHFKKIARWNEVSIATPSQVQHQKRHQQQIDDLKKKITASLESGEEKTKQKTETKFPAEIQKQLGKLRAELKRLETEAPTLPTAMSVNDYEKADDVPVHIRGNHLALGKKVSRGFPLVMLAEGQRQKLPSETSGRLHLADWLVDGDHPLVARVIVNRIWRWHFGRGLVESTDNFGSLGSRPINQELLDWLADRLVRDGWSIKSLHRLILTSATYQQSSTPNPGNLKIDPENRFQWRTSPRRLTAEPIRDSLLFVAGQLDLKMGGSQLHVKNREFLFDHTSKDLTKYDAKTRSIYLPVIRNHLYDLFLLFDYSDASVPNSDRSTTEIPPQALFMMNSELAIQCAKEFAARTIQSSKDPNTRHRWAYETAFGRKPTMDEVKRDLAFLKLLRQQTPKKEKAISDAQVWELFCQTLLMSNEFIYLR